MSTNNRIGNVRLAPSKGNAPQVKQLDLVGTIVGAARFSYAEKPHKGRGTNPDIAYVDYECDLLLPNGKPSGFTLSSAIWEKHEEVIQAGVKGVYKYEDPQFFSAKCFHANTDEAVEAKKRFQEYIGTEYAKWKLTPEGTGEVKAEPTHKSRPAGRLISEFIPTSQYS
jgi:hypothetical protein